MCLEAQPLNWPYVLGPLGQTTDLCSGSRPLTAQVALCARQLLINLHVPSYERRKFHVESIFLEAIDGSNVSVGRTVDLNAAGAGLMS